MKWYCGKVKQKAEVIILKNSRPTKWKKKRNNSAWVRNRKRGPSQRRAGLHKSWQSPEYVLRMQYTKIGGKSVWKHTYMLCGFVALCQSPCVCLACNKHCVCSLPKRDTLIMFCKLDFSLKWISGQLAQQCAGMFGPQNNIFLLTCNKGKH